MLRKACWPRRPRSWWWRTADARFRCGGMECAAPSKRRRDWRVPGSAARGQSGARGGGRSLDAPAADHPRTHTCSSWAATAAWPWSPGTERSLTCRVRVDAPEPGGQPLEPRTTAKTSTGVDLPFTATGPNASTAMRSPSAARVVASIRIARCATGMRFQARGEVHGVADAGVGGALLCAGVAGHDLAGGDADADTDRCASSPRRARG